MSNANHSNPGIDNIITENECIPMLNKQPAIFSAVF